MQLLAVLALSVAVVTVIPEQCVATSSPIVLIPGLMGSQLEVKDNRQYDSWLLTEFCNTGREYKGLWISLERLTVYFECAKEEIPLVYDPVTHSFHDNDQVTIKVPGFGDTESVEYLDPHGLITTVEYFHEMVNYFVDQGYVRGRTIRAAPYDWRLAADEIEKRGYFDRLKALIEDTYTSNDHTKVTLVVHSMGGPVSLYFLTKFRGIDQAWKDRYIHAYIPLSGAWSGGAGTLESVISTNPDIPKWLPIKLVDKVIVPITRTAESIPWLFPNSSAFGNTVLISTPSKDYTANDYEDLFSKIPGYTNGYTFYQHVQGLNQGYPAPNVPTYCMYGDSVETPLKFIYSKDFDGYTSTVGWEPEIVNGDGDGTVNIESSHVCLRWSSMPYPFSYRAFHKVGHTDMVKNKDVFAEIYQVVGAIREKNLFESLLDRLLALANLMN